ncbi:MAG: hypothetical protein NTY12_02415 [Candidatus Falkowbacteria bacterium]|nr:hypothetical protein [Candidatus Falkowbacteria bacterium]
MEERKRLILEIIIKEHIASGCPVASSSIVEKYHVPVSSATVRNDMAELEEDGWIVQPYTSAGRVPTEKAYAQYASELVDKPLSKKETDLLIGATSDDELEVKQAVKQLAALSGVAVIWAFHKYNVYYTGISNLLQQPEFNQPQLVYDVSSIIDRIDDIVGEIFEQVSFTPEIKIGHESPFGIFSGAILSRYQARDRVGLIGLVGPVRMDYAANKARINYLVNQLSLKNN